MKPSKAVISLFLLCNFSSSLSAPCEFVPSLYAQRLDISNSPLGANTPLSATTQPNINQETKFIQMEATVALAFQNFTRAVEKQTIKAYQPLIRAIPLLKQGKGTKQEFVKVIDQVIGDLKKLEQALQAYKIYKKVNNSLYNSLNQSHQDWVQVLLLRQEALAMQKLFITEGKKSRLKAKQLASKKANRLAKRATTRMDHALNDIKKKAAKLKSRLSQKSLRRSSTP